MKNLVKYLGIILVVIGIIVLAIKEFNKMEGNSFLGISAILIILGLVVHVIVNKIISID